MTDSPEQNATPTKSRSCLLGPLIFLISFAVLGLMAEGAHRLYLSMKDTPYDGQEMVESLGQAVNGMKAFVPDSGKEKAQKKSDSAGVLHPYFGSEFHYDTGGAIEYFAKGVPDDTYTVAIVGGSVAARWSSDTGDVFKRALAEDPRLAGKKIAIVRAAHPAHKQPQQLTRLAYLFSLGAVPDAVINLDGFNEVAEGYANAKQHGIHPMFPSMSVWGYLVRDSSTMDARFLDQMIAIRGNTARASDLMYRGEKYHLFKSSLIGTWLKRRIGKAVRARYDLMEDLRKRQGPASGKNADPEGERLYKGPPFNKDPEALFDLCLQSWAEGSRSIQALCESRGVFYLQCLQPTMLDPGAKPKSQKELEAKKGGMDWPVAVEACYPRLRELGKVLQSEGIAFVDLSRMFEEVEQTLFLDPCHLNSPGNDLLGARIAQEFRQRMP